MSLYRLGFIAVFALGCGGGDDAASTPGEAPATPAPGTVTDDSLGLSKTSVFAEPDPIQSKDAGGMPGSNKTTAGYYTGAPPTIPHSIEMFTPITAENNMCMSCHMLPDQIGQEPAAGQPTPIPISHYTNLREDGAEADRTIRGARYTCVQCHVPQQDAKPLVVNTYKQ